MGALNQPRFSSASWLLLRWDYQGSIPPRPQDSAQVLCGADAILALSSSALVVVEEKCGFGLAVRKEAKAERGGRSFLREEGLSGELFELAEADYESLREAGYPSLFVALDKYYILAGPLSLVNERCSLAKTYLQWGCNVDRGEVWLKTRDKAHVFEAGERLWTRYEYGKLAVAKGECFCPDSNCHR
jgi:hypothetical protein